MSAWVTLTSEGDAWAFTAAVVIVFPLLGRFLYARLITPQAMPGFSRRLETYLSIVALEWLLGGLLLALIYRHGLTLNDLGEQPGVLWRTMAVPSLLLAGLAFLVVKNIQQLQNTGIEELDRGLGRGKLFYPKDRAEIAVFMVLALTTGICEELIYRGWVVNFASQLTHSIWIGVVLGAVAFGFGHAHQGLKGMLLTGVLGLLFGAIFVFTSSLFPGQVIHVVLNAVNGLVGAYALTLLTRQPDKGASDGSV
jgi:uncharacterized protein